jgi:ATP-dependent DNA helicase RecG
MVETDLLDLINKGEDSKHQFKMQASHSLFADELETAATFDSFNVPAFSEYYLRSYKEKISDIGIPLQTFLSNKKLMINHHLTIAGLMLFGIEPENIYPQFAIKCTSFPGNVLTTNDYKDSETVRGTLLKQYQAGLYFINRNLHKIQPKKILMLAPSGRYPKLQFEKLYPMLLSTGITLSTLLSRSTCLTIDWKLLVQVNYPIP